MTMTRDEFKTIRHRLGYSQAALARVLGFSDSLTVRRLEMPEGAKSSYQITGQTACFMRVLDNLGAKTVSRIMAEIDPPG